ncbi:hypothetical protein BO86DRAFT_114266 [Aspergillus japonicus CBS 114.51]|uniref:Secreted protein n=1 Tax=Aspergillus japonicus CBS 114.51 TaxID=1448312 RepID=A0A8T8XEL1_ASPJA|nr:hypothetical protein BO86DRAFT_114266 [Aspergillus japonicus CBS 114.51]RAH86565.1 hypothetical protein BO86DRAFT_114266 [Aspergillus japonicus CBS 114.51]
MQRYQESGRRGGGLGRRMTGRRDDCLLFFFLFPLLFVKTSTKCAHTTTQMNICTQESLAEKNRHFGILFQYSSLSIGSYNTKKKK